MDKMFLPTGRQLASVALRYRQWPGARGRLGARGGSRFSCLRGGAAAEVSAARGPAAREERLARLEALLFLSPTPHGSRKLAQLAGLADGTKARTLVRTLNRLYDNEGCAFRVEEVAGGFQLMTRPKFAPWLARLHSAPVEVRLSAPALETLAVVAYRQPVLRAEIESIRGVQCGEILRQLIERDLVRIAGRSQELGRPLLYGTTRQFLQIFGLRHLDELPKRELLRNFPPAGETAPTDREIPDPFHHSRDAGEETNVRTLANCSATTEEIADQHATMIILPPHDEPSQEGTAYGSKEDEDFDEVDDEDEDFDDEDDEDEDELEEDEDFEDEPWEEVGDDEDEFDDDWEDDEDDDWDDDWDEDDDEDDDEEEEDEEFEDEGEE